MIEKPYQENKTNNELKRQGNKAEEQMAFYLRRAFADKKNVWVFNDIYVEHNGEIAQIDHFILFKYGSFIVESKSCLGEISYNKHDEWKRKTKDYYTGFQSPIKQIERQYDILTKNLNHNTETIFGKFVGGLNIYYGGRLKQAVVSIEDSAIINREDTITDFDSIVMKADSVTNFIEDRMKKYSLLKNLNPFSKAEDTIPAFTNKQIENLVNHIKTMDKRIREEKKTEFKNNEKTNLTGKKLELAENRCHACGEEGNLELKNGRYGHYFHCNHCKENKNIKEACPSCKNKQTKLKKFKHLYYLDCSCGFNELYFKNR